MNYRMLGNLEEGPLLSIGLHSVTPFGLSSGGQGRDFGLCLQGPGL